MQTISFIRSVLFAITFIVGMFPFFPANAVEVLDKIPQKIDPDILISVRKTSTNMNGKTVTKICVSSTSQSIIRSCDNTEGAVVEIEILDYVRKMHPWSRNPRVIAAVAISGPDNSPKRISFFILL